MRAAKKSPRRWTRYSADPMTFGCIDVSNRSGKFTPTHHLLIVNEAFKGCGAVISSSAKLEVGDQIRIKVGELEPLDAEVRWVVQLDGDVSKIGVLYLD